MSNQFFPDMPNSEYHGGQGISKTTLDLFSKDVFAPEWSKLCPTDNEKLKTFDFGDAMHAICLEPDRLKSEFVAMPDFNMRTNKGKEDAAAFAEDHKDFKILSDLEMKKLNLMFESVMAHKEARYLIEQIGIAEGSYFWEDEETGLLCKCRPDKHIESLGILVDVKTTPELSKFHFSVDDYRYYVQDPWYCDGVARFTGRAEMKFLVVQKNIECGRYPVMVVKLPPEAIEYGRAAYRDNLRDYADYLHGRMNIETKELAMHGRFMERAYDRINEVIF